MAEKVLQIGMERSWMLDGVLGGSVTAISFLYGFVHLPWGQRALAALSLGMGLMLFAHYFLRRFFWGSRAPSRASMERDFARWEADTAQRSFETVEEEMGALEQMGALALALEHWSKAATHYQRLVRLMENWSARQSASVQKEYWTRRLHFQLAISFALLEGGDAKEGLEVLSLLREESQASEDVDLRLLVEVFYARAQIAKDSEIAESWLEGVLAYARGVDRYAEGLRRVAAEWIELKQPERAVELLEEAEACLKEADYADRVELSCEAVLAYSAAGRLKEAAQMYTRLTRSYLHTNLPHPAVLEHLRQDLSQRFERRALATALQEAQRASQKDVRTF